MINSHFLREAGWTVDCVSKRHSRSQSLSISEIIIPLEYNVTCYKMYYKCRTPTQSELQLIPDDWIDCHIEDLDIDDGSKPVCRRPRDTTITLIDPTPNSVSPEMISKYDGGRSTNTKEKSPEVLTPVILPTTETNKMNSDSDNYNNSNKAYINWKLTLGYCSDNVVLNTLKHTTQYFADSAESEVYAYPQQHCQKQVIPLYLKRIQIRAAGDTFFLSFKSIRGYTYTQLFVLLAYDFL